MGVPSIQGASQTAVPEPLEDPEIWEQPVEPVAAALVTTGEVAPAAAAAPMVLETSSLELSALGLEPQLAAMAAPATATGGSSGNVHDDSYVTFSSLDMAALILGKSREEIAGYGTLTFHFTRDGNFNRWTPVIAKRTTTDGSIYNFLDQSKNQITYSPAGPVSIAPRSDTLPAGLTIDQVRSMSSEDMRALTYQHGWTNRTDGSGHNWANANTMLTVLQIRDGTPLTFLKPTGADLEVVPKLTIILGENGQPIVVDNLDARSIAKLTYNEQKLVGGLPAFYKSGLSARLGLAAVPSKPSNVEEKNYQDWLTQNIEQFITAYGNAINNWSEFPNRNDPGAQHLQTTLTQFTEEHRQLFRTQLDLLAKKLTKQALYNPQTLSDEVSAILDRFKTAHAYGSVNAETANGSGYTSAVSLDQGAAIKSGFENFIAQEKRLLQLAQARDNLETSFSGGKIDLPMLIVQLQLFYTLEKEALIAIKSEEVRQQNELLKTYAAIQRLVTTWSANKDGTAGSTALILFSSVKPEEKHVISMFHLDTASYKHPLEALRKITRPAKWLVDNAFASNSTVSRQTQLEWSNYATQLSDTVTLINQQAQIQMNDISALEKEKNRFFEMGNNSLSRSSEVALAAARNV